MSGREKERKGDGTSICVASIYGQKGIANPGRPKRANVGEDEGNEVCWSRARRIEVSAGPIGFVPQEKITNLGGCNRPGCAVVR